MIRLGHVSMIALTASISLLACDPVIIANGTEDPTAGAGGSPGGGSTGQGGAGGSLVGCSTPVASSPFTLDWPLTSGIFPVEIAEIGFDPSGNLGMTGLTKADVDMGGGVLRSGGTDDVLLAKYDAAGSHVLSKLFGDDSNPQYGDHIAFDADCNMFLAGRFSRTMDLDGTTMTSPVDAVFLAKLDGAGNPLWSQHLNAAYDTDWGIQSIVVDPPTGGVVLLGALVEIIDLGGGPLTSGGSGFDPSRGFMAKFDATGNFVWSKYLPNFLGDHLAVGPSGQVVISGTQDDTIDNDSGQFIHLSLSQSNSSGGPEWINRWTFPYETGSHRSIEMAGVAVNRDGSVIVAGSGNCGLDLGGGALDFRDCESHRAFVAKFAAHGTLIWSRLIEGEVASQAVSLGVDSLGNAFVAGNQTGMLNADGSWIGAGDGQDGRFVVRLDVDGRITWAQELPELSKVRSLAVDPGGNVAILGQEASAATPPSYLYNGNIVTKFNVAAP